MSNPRYRIAVGLTVAALLASCSPPKVISDADRAAVRQEALAILAKRPLHAVVDVVEPMCPSGSKDKVLGEDCVFRADQRATEAISAANKVADEMHVFMDVCKKHRDELAAAIVRDPAFLETLLRSTVHSHDCYLYPTRRETCARDHAVPAVDAEIENMFAKTLAAAIRGDGDEHARATIWTVPGALANFDKLYDNDVRAYQEQVPDLDEQLVTRLLSAAKSQK